MRSLSAFNLQQWIDAHRDALKPPVCNQQVFEDDDFIVMIVGGPNSRDDYHVDEGPEFFYQLEGEILVRTREDGRIVDHRLGEGDTLFIPPNLPHSPQRPPNTVGIVVERVRPPDEMEHLVFYCEDCGELVCDIEFACKDIVEHFRDTMEAFWKDDARRTCKKCGASVPKPEPMTALPSA